MRTLSYELLVWIFVSGTAGCVAPAEDPAGEAHEAAISPNAISPNAISPNAISPNAISPNAISPNAISPNALSASALAALQDPGTSGDLTREFVRYAVSCALGPDQLFAFSWTDTQGLVHDEVYPGLLGLSPGWATGPLGDTGQQIVSACLAARTNYTGASVLISMRSEYDALESVTPQSELAAYPYIEGAFWGNLFADAPHLHACHILENVNHSRAALRECAAGHLEGGETLPCGPIVVEGACSALCNRFNNGHKFYDACLSTPATDGATRTSLVITTGLP